MILDHDETRLRNFEPALTARRHENSEVHHGRFGPVPEALRDRPLVRDIDRVILAELRRSGGADQAVLHAVIGEPGQRLLDPRLFEVIELLARHVHRCYLNSRIQGLQQGVFELAVAIECHHLFLQFPFLVDPQGSDEQGVILNGLRWHGLSPSMNCLLLATGSSRRPPAGLPSLPVAEKSSLGNPIRPRLETEPGQIVVNDFSALPASQPEDAEFHFRSGRPARLSPALPRPGQWTGTRYTTPSTAQTR